MKFLLPMVTAREAPLPTSGPTLLRFMSVSHPINQPKTSSVSIFIIQRQFIRLRAVSMRLVSLSLNARAKDSSESVSLNKAMRFTRLQTQRLLIRRLSQEDAKDLASYR